MSTLTNNLKLNKPDTEDFYDISLQNENMDIIDSKLKELEDSVSSSNDLDTHILDNENPHKVTASQLGITVINNTVDSEKSVKYANAATSATRALQDGEGNSIVETYATKTSLANNIGSTNILKVDFEEAKAVTYILGKSQLLMHGFVTDSLCAISIAGHLDTNINENSIFRKILDDNIFGDFFKNILVNFDVPMKDGTVRECYLSVMLGNGVVGEYTFAKNGVEYKTYDVYDYINDDSYELTNITTHSGIEIQIRNLLDSSYMNYPIVINTSTIQLI